MGNKEFDEDKIVNYWVDRPLILMPDMTITR